jgi:hypothetical protein
MAKFIQTGEDSFDYVREESDASEQQVTDDIEAICLLAASIAKHGYSAEVRAADRGGYYRYASVERSLNLIQGFAASALKNIKSLDFPEDRQADRTHS